MSRYAWICGNMPTSAWLDLALHFPIVILCLLERVFTYFNVYTKLDVIVWRNMSLFSLRDKIWYFSIVAESIWFVFALDWIFLEVRFQTSCWRRGSRRSRAVNLDIPNKGLLENRSTFLMKIKHSAFLFKIIFLKKIST